jgi:hypothetical protein
MAMPAPMVPLPATPTVLMVIKTSGVTSDE